MKILFTAFLLFLLAASASAEEDSRIKKAKEFLEKRNACDLAIGFFSKQYDAMANVVRCVGDFTIKQGTINETSGCGFRNYDMDRNQYQGYDSGGWGDYSPDTFIPGERCASGGFEKLLKKSIAMNMRCAGPTVAECATSMLMANFDPVLLYAGDEKYRKWFEGVELARKAKEEQAAQKRAQDKSSQKGGKKKAK